MKTAPEQRAKLKERADADLGFGDGLIIKHLLADLEEAEAKQQEADQDNLLLIQTVKYLRGIPERAGRVQGPMETIEQFVLGYVKHLEAELAATRKQLVYEFNGDDVPSFRAGVLIPHELEDVVDAERCRSLANIITGLRKQLEAHERNAGEPTELEMHRADYEACKAAGFQSPGELLSAYKVQSKQLAEAQAFNQQAAGGLMAWSCCVPDYFPGKHNPQDCIGKYKCTATSALQSAIAEAVEPYKRDAERYQFVKSRTDIAEDDDSGTEWYELNLKYRGEPDLDAAIDSALAAKEGK